MPRSVNVTGFYPKNIYYFDMIDCVYLELSEVYGMKLHYHPVKIYCPNIDLWPFKQLVYT